MTTFGAYDVAAELRRRLPGVGLKKLHKLLYYCQGHHLATFAEPLFQESISAFDMGPVVGTLWYRERQPEPMPQAKLLGERELNTVGYVISRYGALNGTDLEHLTHEEDPWKDADKVRPAHGSVKIANEAIENYFRSAAADDDDGTTPAPDDATLVKWLEGAQDRLSDDLHTDSIEDLIARLEPSA